MRHAWCLLACLLGCETPIENTFPNRTTSASQDCNGDYPDLFEVVLWSGNALQAECFPYNTDQKALITFFIEDWDHTAGTFEVDDETSHGTLRVTGDFDDVVTGTATIASFDEYPREFGWDLNIGSGGTLLTCHSMPEGGC